MQITIGTVTVTNGSNRVIGTADSANLLAGWLYASPGNVFTIQGSGIAYNIASIVLPGASVSGFYELTLTGNYGGPTKAGAIYCIVTDFTPNFGLPLINRGDVETNTIFSRAMTLIDSMLTAKSQAVIPLFQSGDCILGNLGTYSPNSNVYIIGLEANVRNAPTGGPLTIQLQDNLGNPLGLSLSIPAGQTYAKISSPGILVNQNAVVNSVVTLLGTTYSGSDINFRIIVSATFIPPSVLALLTPTSNRTYIPFYLEGDAVLGAISTYSPDVPIEVIGMEVNVDTAPTGANLIVTLYANAATTGNSCAVVAGSTYQRTIFASPYIAAPNALLTANITQVGSGTSGQNVKVTLITATPNGVLNIYMRSYIPFNYDGDAAVVAIGEWTPDINMTVIGMELNATTAPTGANLLVELYEGATAESAETGTLAIGSLYQRTIFGAAFQVAAGISVTFKITQIGSVSPGQNVSGRLIAYPT